MSFLPIAFDATLQSLVVVQTSLATPWLPLIHALLDSSPAVVICVGILHPPDVILTVSLKFDKHRVKVVDWTTSVPNFEGMHSGSGLKELHGAVLDAIASVPPGPVTLIVDSPDTLRADLGSVSTAYTYLQDWSAALTSRNSPTRMILPIPAHSPLLPRIIAPTFFPAFIHLTLHPPKLLHHLVTEHLAPAPSDPRFWALFLSSSTGTQAEQLVWGDGGTGWDSTELVVDVLVRRRLGRRVERTIEGWRPAGPCALTELAELRNVWSMHPKDRNRVAPAADSAAHEVSFNLVLTDAQQRARAQVPLPYVHTGSNINTHKEGITGPSPGAILYDPDSADDLDDDDPDEDLDI